MLPDADQEYGSNGDPSQEAPLEFLRNRIFCENWLTISRAKLSQWAVCLRALCLDPICYRYLSMTWQINCLPIFIVPLPRRVKVNRSWAVSITVNSAFTPSANSRIAVNKARVMLYSVKTSFIYTTREILSEATPSRKNAVTGLLVNDIATIPFYGFPWY